MAAGKPFKKGHDERRAKGGKREGAGRPSDWLRQACQKHTDNILGFLHQVALGQDVEQVITEDGETVRVPAPVKERIKASEAILDRGYGKASQPVELNNADGTEFSILPTRALGEILDVLRRRVDPKAGKPSRVAERE